LMVVIWWRYYWEMAKNGPKTVIFYFFAEIAIQTA
jgi:hypothetical protein